MRPRAASSLCSSSATRFFLLITANIQTIMDAIVIIGASPNVSLPGKYFPYPSTQIINTREGTATPARPIMVSMNCHVFGRCALSVINPITAHRSAAIKITTSITVMPPVMSQTTGPLYFLRIVSSNSDDLVIRVKTE